MSRRDVDRDATRKALENDGWTITHDPLKLGLCSHDPYVDFGAERLLRTEKGLRKIAVVLENFVDRPDLRELVGRPDVRQLGETLKRHIVYQIQLAVEKTDRVIYLAVSEETYRDVFEGTHCCDAIESGVLRLVVFDESREVIIRWIP